MRQFHHKIRQLVQNATFITNDTTRDVIQKNKNKLEGKQVPILGILTAKVDGKQTRKIIFQECLLLVQNNFLVVLV